MKLDAHARIPKRFVSIAALLCCFWGVAFALDEDEQVLREAGLDLLAALGAEPSGCPDLPPPPGDYQAHVCGRVEKPARNAAAIREVVDGKLANQPLSVRPETFPWMQEGRRHWRRGAVNTATVVFGFNERSGKMAFYYPKTLDHCLPDEQLTPRPWPDGFLGAAVMEGREVRPEYPEPARVARTGGTVILETVIDAKGRVGEVCVRGESRAGYGFAEAAKQALQQWRFHPAEQDGRPVVSSMSVSFDFFIP